MKKQTAVEWLQEKLQDYPDNSVAWVFELGLIEQAKEMEKEQLKDHFDEGYGTGYLEGIYDAENK